MILKFHKVVEMVGRVEYIVLFRHTFKEAYIRCEDPE